MLNSSLFFRPLIFTILYLLSSMVNATMTDSQSLQSPLKPIDSQFDIDQIQVPAYVSTSFTNNLGSKRPTAMDHSITSTISVSVHLCKKIGGEKGAAACSYLLNGRPWRQWGQKLSQYFLGVKARYTPITYNFMVKTFIHPYIDGTLALRDRIHDWWNFPSLEWHLLKARLVALGNKYYDCYCDWRSGKNDWRLAFRDDRKLEPDQDGCYYDALGTVLCVDEQRLLDANGLNDRVNELLEGMTYEERSYTLRFQQRFIQWATKASLLTTEALDRAQSIWLQHTQAIYQFLDDALNLDPHSSKHDHEPTSQMRTTHQLDLCPPLVFPFSVSPFDTSLETTFFSFESRPRYLQSATSKTPSTGSYLSAIPIRQPWSACLSTQNDNITDNSDDYDDTGMPKRKSIRVSQELLDPYNKIQHHYLLMRLQKEMTKQLERLEKETLQEYYRAMVTATHQWTVHHYDHHQQSKHRQQLQKRQMYKPGYAAQQLYQELRLYINISLHHLYQKSIQQLMDTTEQYDKLVMKQVKHAYEDSEWFKKQQARRLFTFYPLYDETSTTNQLAKQPDSNSLSSYLTDSIIKRRAVKFIGQRADWAIQSHRRTVLQQWRGVFENMERQSHSIWVSAMDQAQGRHRIWASCNGTCALFMNVVKLLTVLVFLLWL